MTEPPPTLSLIVRPTVDQVAALLRARTKDFDGNEVGTFNDATRPTALEVAEIIELAYGEITGAVGSIAYDPCSLAATSLVALRAAMWVELSYFPEQIRSDRSVYTELAAQWPERLEALQSCIDGNVPNGDDQRGYRFGVLDVHGWTASPYYGAPQVPRGS